MKYTIDTLYKKFSNIKNLGWVQSAGKGNGGIGLTFETLIGVPRNDFEIPDFNGVEIKTKKNYGHSYITLFSAKPDGPHFHETERLRNEYGYPHSKLKQYKVLNNEVFANRRKKTGINYYFKLEVNRAKQKLFLLIYDVNGNLIEDEVFWYFDTLKEKLYRKLKILALVKANVNLVNNIQYFQYDKMTIYLLKDFDTFISLIEKGIIRISFKINIFLSGPKRGNICDHGTSFDIKECDLSELYDLYDSSTVDNCSFDL